MRGVACSALMALATTLGGCDLVFEAQDVVITHDVEGDALDVLLVYRGISAAPDDDAVPDDSSEAEQQRERRLTKAVTAFERVAAGAREGMIVDWPLYASLDDSRAEAQKELAKASVDADDKARTAEFLAIDACITLTDHGAFLDDRGRLCGFQRVRIQPASKFVSLLNECFDGVARRAAAKGDSRDDAQGIAMRLAKSDAKTPWIAIDRGVIRVDVPLSAAERAAGFRDIAQDMAHGQSTPAGISRSASGFSLVGEWLATARSIAFDDAGMRIEFGTGDAPIHWTIACPERPYDAALLAALQSKGTKFREDVKADDLIAAMK